MSKTLEDVRSKLEEILITLLPGPPEDYTARNKVIHDHLWGSSSFYRWEVTLLDTPLLQRLRQIHQLGTASFTYPSAVHTRFSHTLGVTVLAGDIITNLRNKVNDGSIICPKDQRPQDIITQRDIYTVRLSALLHDIGHCFFSHCTEQLATADLKALSDDIIEKAEGVFSSGEPPKPHEMIAYGILNTQYFNSYWESKIIPLFGEAKQDIPKPCEFAKPIVGMFISDEKKYVTEIMNGPYDVDKLEYLHRDAKSAGLAITYDRDRFFQKITLHYDEDCWKLVMGVQGIQSVEQMMLNKMMLAPYVYHHQKVLSADALVQDIGRVLLSGAPHQTIKVTEYLDFLRYSDSDLLALGSSSEDAILRRLLYSLQNRIFPKRCFVLHKDYIVAKDETQLGQMFSEIRKSFFEDLQNCRKGIAEIISRKTKKPFSEFDIYITNTSQKAKYQNIAKSAMVLTLDNKVDRLCDHWVMGNWDETYSAKKEYIYFHITGADVEIGFDAVNEYLERFDAKFDLARIRNSIKISPSEES